MLTHLGDLAPSPIAHVRNANPGSKNYDYVREFIKLKKWALSKYGQHKYRGFDDTELPRIIRRDAIVMADWWEDAVKDIRANGQLGKGVQTALIKMQVPAYGSAKAARSKRKPSKLMQELTESEAAYFWEGMSEIASSIGAAKKQPNLFDKGVLLWESFVESAEELPTRLVEQGKKLTDDFQTGVDKVVTTVKWAGIIGGGLLTTYVLMRLIPERKKDELV